MEVLQRCGEILDAGSMEQKLIKRVLSNNELGPVVFVTPEIAPWSTIGLPPLCLPVFFCCCFSHCMPVVDASVSVVACVPQVAWVSWWMS